MGGDDESGETFVDFRVDRIADDAEHVETREDGLGEFDILREWDSRVVAAADRVGGGDDRAAGLEGGYNAGLGN